VALDVIPRTVFPVEDVIEMRSRSEQLRAAGRAVNNREDALAMPEPMDLLTAFPALRLKTGLTLRAYLHGGGIGGRGTVWALPDTHPFPDRGSLFDLKEPFPSPPEALDDVMDAIEGDGSAWAYLSASLLARELAEYGAWWHGSSWDTHRILGRDPWVTPPSSTDETPSHDFNLLRREAWCLRDSPPQEWAPVVWEESFIHVIFHTYSGYRRSAIYRHWDVFRPRAYRFESDVQVLADGPGGYIF
jgi:hypothetical protein